MNDDKRNPPMQPPDHIPGLHLSGQQSPCMTLDVVVPTFNRCDLLCRTIRSLFQAKVPAQLQVRLFIVDNNSTDGTAAAVRALQTEAPLPLTYLRAPLQGSSAARNTGIAAGDGELVGFVDDDEEVHAAWYEVIAREFADDTLGYIGGPCLLNTEAPLPAWLPPGYHAAIGAIPPKPRAPFGPHHPGILCGGNAVVRRNVFAVVGQYSQRLGRSARGLLSEEDADFYRRLQAAGIAGMYVPELIILHHVHEHRLTRAYHRRWAYWRAVSQGVLAREVQEPVAHLLGIPRYRFGRAAGGLQTTLRGRLTRRSPGKTFAGELAVWDLVGFVHGRYFFEEARHYTTTSPPLPAYQGGEL